jgi:transcriptional regulator with XRE-family HTH domain
MNNQKQLVAMVAERFGDTANTKVVADRSIKRGGPWSVSWHKPNGYSVEVEWRPHLGYGLVGTKEFAFGTGVDEIFAGAEYTATRVAELLVTEQETNRLARELSLREIREAHRMTQSDLASVMCVTKSSLAQREAGDVTAMTIHSVQEIARALGGALEVSVCFADGRRRSLDLGRRRSGSEKSARPARRGARSATERAGSRA